MVSPRPAERFTEAEYLALEAASDTKHEYVDGYITAMAGARPAHNQLAMNMGAHLLGYARGRGRAVMTSDQRVHIPATSAYVYPDVTVACGERAYRKEEPPSLVNPVLLVEVTSKTTLVYDYGAKFLQYQTIPSLREYIVVSHRERRIDHHRRLDTGQWLITALTKDDEVVELTSLAGTLRLDDVYQGVDLDEGA